MGSRIVSKGMRDTHGIHVHSGEIKVTWKKDDSAMSAANYTLTAQNITPANSMGGRW